MLTFTTTQSGAQSARSLRAPIYVVAVLLLVTTFLYGQPVGRLERLPGLEAPRVRGLGGIRWAGVDRMTSRLRW
jgi:hypothetical protein